jgi:hypothetical protein
MASNGTMLTGTQTARASRSRTRISSPITRRKSCTPGQRGQAERGSEGGRCPRRRSMAGQDAELPMCRQVCFKIRFRVPKRDVVLLEQRMDLEPRVQVEESANLRLGQRTGPIPSTASASSVRLGTLSHRASRAAAMSSGRSMVTFMAFHFTAESVHLGRIAWSRRSRSR